MTGGASLAALLAPFVNAMTSEPVISPNKCVTIRILRSSQRLLSPEEFERRTLLKNQYHKALLLCQ